MKKFLTLAVLLFVLIVYSAPEVRSQTTEFTYQGSLKDGANPANGNYDFEFLLFDSLTGGTQQGATLTRSSVAVAGGTFSVKLDFGSQFPGANRFLEIHVRPAGGGAFTPLTPRQSVGSSPYAVQSLNAANATTAATAGNATQLGGVAASQYVLTTDPRMSDARAPTAGSSNYIQNGTSLQSSSNFNISGDGTAGGTLKANVIDATTQLNISSVKMLFTPGSGVAGNGGNLVVGQTADAQYSSGGNNTYVGTGAAFRQTTGDGNAYFGAGAGINITGGSGNSFFGDGTGISIVASGNNNTFIGAQADGAQGISNATAVGQAAKVTLSNSLVLGSISGTNGATADTKVGIGVTGPLFKLHVIDPSNTGLRVQTNAVGGTVASFGGNGSFQVDSPGTNGGRLQILENGNVGIGNTNPVLKLEVSGAGSFTGSLTAGSLSTASLTSTSISNSGTISSSGISTSTLVVTNNAGIGTPIPQARLDVAGTMRVQTLTSGFNQDVCVDAQNLLSNCSSSRRYKDNITDYTPSLDLVQRLRPVYFTWKQNGIRDMGLIAEEVNEVEPLLVTHNADGEVEGVKYSRISVLLVNAVREQQAQIEALEKDDQAQREQIAIQQRQIEALKALLCRHNTKAAICQTGR